MKILFTDLPAEYFTNCKASDFHPGSHIAIKDANDLKNYCKLRISLINKSGPRKSIITIGKIHKSLQLSLALTNSEIYIGDDSVGKWQIRSWHGSKFFLSGKNIRCNGAKCIMERNAEISIGADCMFSDEVLIQCGSQHSIISLEDKRQINTDKSIINIGDHVWLGRRSTIMSSSRTVSVGKGSILGINSTLTRSIPATSLAVGAPASAVKSKMSWSFNHRCSDEELNRICSMFPED